MGVFVKGVGVDMLLNLLW